MMKSCKILNVARLLALALVAVLLIPACLPVAHAATATKLALLMEAEKYQYIEGDMFDPEGLVLRVTYDDGTTQNITEGFTFDERHKAGLHGRRNLGGCRGCEFRRANRIRRNLG